MMILKVLASSNDEVFAAAVDKELGSIILRSLNGGKNWTFIRSRGSNLDIALTGNGQTLCGVGTKLYCIPLDEGIVFNGSWQYPVSELSLRASAKEIHSFGDNGMAIVGLFHSPLQTEYVNGIMLNPDLSRASWQPFNVGLETKHGFFASSASFPSNNTWFVVSTSWPVQNTLVSSMLSGRLNIVPGKELLSDYLYEFLSLTMVRPNQYMGAISKTDDGGVTWKKVFDSDRNFYLNQIHCFDTSNCVTVGEGSFTTMVLITHDGGEQWDTVFRLNSRYSLHTCRMISEREIWVAGGMKVDNVNHEVPSFEEVPDSGTTSPYMGVLYHSLDGGRTWEMSSVDGYVFDLHFGRDKVGYAANLFLDHCRVSKYTPQTTAES